MDLSERMSVILVRELYSTVQYIIRRANAHFDHWVNSVAIKNRLTGAHPQFSPDSY